MVFCDVALCTLVLDFLCLCFHGFKVIYAVCLNVNGAMEELTVPIRTNHMYPLRTTLSAAMYYRAKKFITLIFVIFYRYAEV